MKEEFFSAKKYKSMKWFIKACERALIKVFGDADQMTIFLNGKTVEDRVRNFEFVEYNHGGGLTYKAGFVFEHLGHIYVFYQDREKTEVQK